MLDWATSILAFLYWSSPFVATSVIFFGQTYLKSIIEAKIKHDFDLKLETLRRDFRQKEEEIKSDLRSRETEISALQSTLLSGRTQRLALIDKRRFEAAEKIWNAISELAALRNMVKFMGSVDLNALANGAHQDRKYQEMAKFFTDIVPEEKLKLSSNVSVERLFVSPLAWAYYSAYATICYLYLTIAKMIQNGTKDPIAMIDEEGIAKLLKTALPNYNEFIEKFGMNGFPQLLEPLSESLLTELRREMEDSSIDQTRAQKAKAIMDALKDVKPVDSGA